MAIGKLSVTVPEKVIKEIDRRRVTEAGTVSRSAFVTSILEGFLYDRLDKNQTRIGQ